MKKVIIYIDKDNNFIIKTKLFKNSKRPHFVDVCAIAYTYLTGWESITTPLYRENQYIVWQTKVETAIK
jgi:hypothetical protein